jgi:hypothetical protein
LCNLTDDKNIRNRWHWWLILLTLRSSHSKKQSVAALTFKRSRNLVGTLSFYETTLPFS